MAPALQAEGQYLRNDKPNRLGLLRRRLPFQTMGASLTAVGAIEGATRAAERPGPLIKLLDQ
jgi:hypothetical protein